MLPAPELYNISNVYSQNYNRYTVQHSHQGPNTKTYSQIIYRSLW